jgi:LysM repeat protein
LTAGPTVAPTSLPTIQPSPVTEAPVIHIVKLDDNLYDISLAYGTTVDAIKLANGLESNNLRVGQELIIPQGTFTPVPTPTTTPAITPTP